MIKKKVTAICLCVVLVLMQINILAVDYPVIKGAGTGSVIFENNHTYDTSSFPQEIIDQINEYDNVILHERDNGELLIYYSDQPFTLEETWDSTLETYKYTTTSPVSWSKRHSDGSTWLMIFGTLQTALFWGGKTTELYIKGTINTSNFSLTINNIGTTELQSVIILIPTEGSTITNANSFMEIATNKPYLKIEVYDNTDNKLVCNINSYQQSNLFTRVGPNPENMYDFGIAFRDLPFKVNHNYTLSATGMEYDGELYEATSKATRNFFYDDSWFDNATIKIEGITEGSLYENNAKFSVTRSWFYRDDVIDVKLNNIVIQTLGAGAGLKSPDYNLFNKTLGVDPRNYGVNTLSVIKRSNGDVLSTVNFYLKTPYNPETGQNEDDFTYEEGELQIDVEDGKPTMPTGINPIDYIKYVFLYLTYLFGLIGKVLTNLLTTATDAFAIIGKILNFLPSPLPELLTGTCVISIVVGFIKLIFKR